MANPVKLTTSIQNKLTTSNQGVFLEQKEKMDTTDQLINMKKNVIDFYENTRQLNSVYHNHKEVSAWAGLVLYGVVSTLIISLPIPKINSLLMTLGLLAAQCFFLALFTMFTYNQLRMKNVANNFVAASTRLLSDIILEKDHEFKAEKYMRVEPSGHTHSQQDHTLPTLLLKKAKDFDSKGKGFHNTTVFTIVGLYIFMTILVLFCRLLMLCS
jgi:hypothetical protein